MLCVNLGRVFLVNSAQLNGIIIDWSMSLVKAVHSVSLSSQCHLTMNYSFGKTLSAQLKCAPLGISFSNVILPYCPVVSSWIAMYFWPIFWVWFLFPLQKRNNKCIRGWTLRKTPDSTCLVRAVHWRWIPSTVRMDCVCEKGTLIAGLTHKGI